MTRRRFFVPASEIRDGVARLPPDELHHLRHVLRLNAGTQVEVFDGRGRSYTGRVEGEGANLRVGSLAPLDTQAEPAIDCTLALALIRAERFEWALEKATELGVRAIVPIAAARSEVRLPPSRLDARLDRWRRIVRSAAKQSRRSAIPEIERPCSLEQLVAATGSEGERLLLAERGGNPWPTLGARRVVVAVGPEGGWEPGELRAAESAGWHRVGLGPRVLRAETAAVAALALIQFTAGDLKPPERPDPDGSA
jgi:16S rRNA (uracil1498-N3)-methyltransferase